MYITYSLTLSEQLMHKNALIQGFKAIEQSIKLLLITKLTTQYYLYTSTRVVKKNKQNFNKVKYLSSFIQVIDSVIRLVNFIPFSKHTNPILKDCIKIYDEALRKDNLLANSFDIDYSYFSNPEIYSNSYLVESTILSLSQLNFFQFDDVFVHDTLENEISENSLLEKIAFLVLGLYIYSTEIRFLENQKQSSKPFFKHLVDYFDRKSSKQLNKSEVFLTKAVEIGYQYLPETFPFLNQILSVYSKF